MLTESATTAAAGRGLQHTWLLQRMRTHSLAHVSRGKSLAHRHHAAAIKVVRCPDLAIQQSRNSLPCMGTAGRRTLAGRATAGDRADDRVDPVALSLSCGCGATACGACYCVYNSQNQSRHPSATLAATATGHRPTKITPPAAVSVCC